MTKKVEYTILTAFVGLVVAIAKVWDATTPITESGLEILLIWSLAKLGVEVIGKPVIARLFPRAFRRIHTPPE